MTLKIDGEEVVVWMYGKLGRAVSLVPASWGTVGGDNEWYTLLLDLHEECEKRRQEALMRGVPANFGAGRRTVFLLGSRCADEPEYIPDWCINPWSSYGRPLLFGRVPLGNAGADESDDGDRRTRDEVAGELRSLGYEGNVSFSKYRLAVMLEELKATGQVSRAGRTYTDEHMARAQQNAAEHIYTRVLRPWVKYVDASVLLLGQHGTTNTRVLKTDGSGTLTSPLDMSGMYAAPLIMFVNEWEGVVKPGGAGTFSYGKLYGDDPDDNLSPNTDGQSPLFSLEVGMGGAGTVLTGGAELMRRAAAVVNEGGRRVIWICHDSRNYLKARDIARRPAEVLGQFAFVRTFRTLDGSAFDHAYEYACAEIGGVVMPDVQPASVNERTTNFGMIVNETAKPSDVTLGRLYGVMKYALPLFDETSYLHGTWTPESQKVLKEELAQLGTVSEEKISSLFPVTGIVRNNVLARLASTRWTVTFPGNGAGWATAKIWEGMSMGVIMFMHPSYDTQDNVLPREMAADDAPDTSAGRDVRFLRDWLRVNSPEQLARRVQYLRENEDVEELLRAAQWRHFVRAKQDAMVLKRIFEMSER